MISLQNTELSYVVSGLFSTDKEWIHPRRRETTYEIILVIDGYVYIEEEGVEYPLEKGDLLILRPGVVHKGYQPSYGKTSFYWLHFTASNFKAFGINYQLFKHYTNTSFFKQILHIAHSPNYPRFGADTAVATLLAELAAILAQDSTKGSKVVAEAAEWIRINAYQRLTVKEVSQRYGYNSEHFSRLFKRFYHVGLKDYICAQRLNYACGLLCNSAFSIKEIADIMNFDDANQFVHFFTYHQKQSPSQFRNRFYSVLMNQN